MKIFEKFEKKILVVEVAAKHIMAALVAKKGRKIEILDFSQINKSNPEDILPAIGDIRTLAMRMGYTSGPAACVTSLARAVEISMNREKVSAMNHYQLKEAVKWEVEPYTGVPGTQAIIGVKKEDEDTTESDVVTEADEIGADGTDIALNVSVMERNIYRAVKERFRIAGFKLLRIYPPDVCFYMPLFVEAFKGTKAILDIGEDYSNFAILKGKKPVLINTISASVEAITDHLKGNLSVELESNLKFTARQVPEPMPLIISGPGAGERLIVDYISSLCANGAEPISLEKTAGLTVADRDDSDAVFASVVGAGIRELGSKNERLVGISDAEPLAIRLKRSAYLAPVIATAFLVVFFFGHYQYMVWQEDSFKLQIAEISAELERREAGKARFDRAKAEMDALEREIELAEKRIALVTYGADADIAQVIDFFNDIAVLIPEDVVLEAIVQEGELKYRITGRSRDLSYVGIFASAMQKREWCESVVINSIGKIGTGWLGFEFSVKTQEAGR